MVANSSLQFSGTPSEQTRLNTQNRYQLVAEKELSHQVIEDITLSYINCELSQEQSGIREVKFNRSCRDLPAENLTGDLRYYHQYKKPS